MADRKRERKPPIPVVRQLRKIIHDARRATARPDSQPAISSIMLGRRSFVQKIGRTRGLRMYLVAVGLAAEVRRFLKLEPDDDGGSVTTAQLDLWPQKLREAVAEIGQARVFVPSRAEFVMLTPMTISAAEAKEAGGYLVSKGNECIRRGTQLIALADRM